MRKILALLTVLAVVHTTAAQTVTVTDAEGTVRQISASDAGVMTYSQENGTLTIGGWM